MTNGVESDDRKWLEKLLERLGVSPERLAAKIRERRPDDETVLGEDSIGWLLETTVQREISATRSAQGGLRRAVREAGALANGGSLLQELPSRVLRLGSEAHAMAEELLIEGLEEVARKHAASLDIGGPVTEFRWGLVQASLFQEEGEEQQTRGKILGLEIPLPGLTEGQSIGDWARGLIRDDLAIIAKCNSGRLPVKPNDVERILADREHGGREALVRVIEVGQMVFGVRRAMAVVDANNRVSAEVITEYKALNWLALLDRFGEREEVDKETGILAELPLGDVYVRDGDEVVAIRGGKVDIIRLGFREKTETLAPFSLGLRGVVALAESEFGSQRKVHHKYREGRISSTRFGRSLETCLEFLSQRYGDKLWENLTIEEDDLKFLGGDGGWREAFNGDMLPMTKHRDQILTYLFLTIVQMYRVENRKGQTESLGERKEKIPDVSDLTDFAQKRRLWERVRGKLMYQIPGDRKEYWVGFENAEQFLSYGKRLLEESKELVSATRRRDLVTELGRIMWPEGRLVRVRREREAVDLDELGGWFKTLEDQHYLLINKVREAVGTESGEIKIIRAARYRSGEIVMWVNKARGRFRIAVNDKGRVVVDGWGDNLIEGKLSENAEMAGVVQIMPRLWNLFGSEIWGKLGDRAIDERDKRVMGSGYLSAEGKIEGVVPGKPVVCLFNPMTGRWRLDRNSLNEAMAVIRASEIADDFGLSEIVDLLGKREQGQVLCPIPGHDNRNWKSKAAYLYEGHIYCFSCNAMIDIPSGRYRAEGVWLPGDRMENYVPVSADRERVLGWYFEMTKRMAEELPDAREYLAKRGLALDDLGRYGYMPPEAAELFDQTMILVGKEDTKLMNKLTLDGFIRYMEGREGRETVTKLREKLVEAGLKWEEVDNVSLRTMMEAEQRGIFRTKVDEETGIKERDNRMGGRVIWPLWWLDQKGRWKISNFCGRGIPGQYDENEPKYEKLPLRKRVRQRSPEGLRLLPTPAGLWTRNIETLVDQVRSRGEIVVCEGIITAASLVKLKPELEGITIAVMGVGHQMLTTLVNWLNEKVDEEHRLRKVILALDFDLGGAGSTQRVMDKCHFKDVEMTTILYECPEFGDRSYNPDDYEKGGRFFGQMLDFNDILISRLDKIQS